MKKFYLIAFVLFATFTIAQANTPISTIDYPPNVRQPGLRPMSSTVATPSPSPTASATSTPTPGPSGSPTPQPSPTGTILTSFIPVPLATMASMRGVDTPTNYPAGGFPWTSFLSNLQISYTRGFPTSADPNESQYQAAFAAGNVCPSATLSIGGDPRYNVDTTGTTRWTLSMTQFETDVTNTTYSGGSSPPSAISQLLSCTPAINGTNEFNAGINTQHGVFADTINGISGYIGVPVDPTNPSGWATGSSAWATSLVCVSGCASGGGITGGTPAVIDAPGGGSVSNCGSNKAQFYACPGNWAYIMDNTSTGAGEHVQITSVNTSSGTIGFTPANNHAAGAVVTTDISWDEAEYQYGAFLFIRHNSAHPEYNLMPNLSTIAFSNISSTANGTFGPVSSVDEAFQQQTAGFTGGPYHLWSVGSGETHPYSDSLHYHTSTCGQFAPFGTGSSNSWYEYGQFVSYEGVTPAWQQGAFTGENIFFQGAAFGNSGSPVPYVPTGASQCGVPEFATAQYVAVGPYVMRQQMPWAYEMEPGPYVGWDNPLVNAMLDAGTNFFWGTYVQANSQRQWQDTTTGTAAMTPLQFTNWDPGNVCTTPPSYLNTSNNSWGPSGCTWIYAIGQSADGNNYTMGVQQISQSGLESIASTVSCPTSPPGNTGQYGNCQNNPIPTPNPTISASAFTVTFGNSIKQANVYQFTNVCNKPTSWILAAPTSAPSPSPTSSPNISVAANTECGDYALIGSYTTTNPSWMSVTVTPVYTVPIYYFQLSKNTFAVAPLPQITPIPMLTPNSNPAGSIPNFCVNIPCSPNITTLTGT